VLNTAILLVDDHQVMREGLRVLLEKQPNLKVVAEAEDGRAAVEMVKRHTPHVVVMDVGMPDLNGIEATRQVVALESPPRVIALSVHADRRYVVEMFKAGASGYLLKNCATDELVRAIDAVMAGQSFLSPGITNVVVDEALHRGVESRRTAYTVLTRREREVLQLLAEGGTSKQIAAELNLAVRTIETHRREIMRKLDMHSVAALTKYAIREGLTSLEA
jgi:DNA-binding NarL/FixJ family response regulator